MRREHFVEARLLDIEDFSLERENRLVTPVSSLLRGASGRISLDKIELTQSRVSFLAIRQLAGQRAGVQRTFATRQIFRFARRFAHPRRFDTFCDDLLCLTRVFAQVAREFLIDQRLDDAFDLAVTEPRFGLAFELRLRDFYTDNRGQSFTDVFTLKVLLVFL